MKKMIVANWKMNYTVQESISLVRELKNLLKTPDKCDIVLCPAFTSLHAVSGEIGGTGIKLGAQNMHYEDSGAYTGEVSPLMLKEAGCEYVIIGHSERREIFGERDSMVNKKIFGSLKNSLMPIVCVGEDLQQRIEGMTYKVIEQQLNNCMKNVTKEEFTSIIIAYEPLWAISRGNPNQKPATKEDAEKCHDFIRKQIEKMYDIGTAASCRIIYGGSLKPENAKEILSMPNIDGGLVGNASLKAQSFADIINSASSKLLHFTHKKRHKALKNKESGVKDVITPSGSAATD